MTKFDAIAMLASTAASVLIPLAIEKGMNHRAEKKRLKEGNIIKINTSAVSFVK